jgi:hypothetical protein
MIRTLDGSGIRKSYAKLLGVSTCRFWVLARCAGGLIASEYGLMSSATGNRAGLAEQAWAAVAGVRDPETGMPLGELGMVRGVDWPAAT